MFRYAHLFESSSFFKVNGMYNKSLTSSIMKFMKYDVYLQDEPIVVAGQECSNIYFILEGEASIINFDLKFLKKINPGNKI